MADGRADVRAAASRGPIPAIRTGHLDISHAGWGGAQKDPGRSGNEVGPSRGLVPKFAERRAAAAAEMAARTRK
jgi:hypothetical protein